MTPSIEHVMSLEPQDMSRFVGVIRDIERAMGGSRRIMTQQERQRRLAVRRSVCAKANLPEGHRLREEDLDYRRPGTGIAPDATPELVGRVLALPLEAGQMLDWSNVLPRETP